MSQCLTAGDTEELVHRLDHEVRVRIDKVDCKASHIEAEKRCHELQTELSTH